MIEGVNLNHNHVLCSLTTIVRQPFGTDSVSMVYKITHPKCTHHKNEIWKFALNFIAILVLFLCKFVLYK